MTHQKCKSLKLECLNLDDEYSITISPPDYRDSKTARSNSVQIQIDFRQKLEESINFFKKLKHCSLLLFTELSPTGRIHFHGYLKILDIWKFIYQDVYFLNQMSYEIDTMKPDCEDKVSYANLQYGVSQKYQDYCMKQSGVMAGLMDNLDIPYPIKIGKYI